MGLFIGQSCPKYLDIVSCPRSWILAWLHLATMKVLHVGHDPMGQLPLVLELMKKV